MPPQIKICGLSTTATLDAAIAGGATHIGLNCYEPSPRYIPLDRARALRDRIPGHLKSVLLLVNASPDQTQHAIATVRPDIVQFHGSETPEWLRLVKQFSRLEVWKALGLKDKATLASSDRYVGAADLLLFDAPATTLPGGTGLRFDWTVLDGYEHKLPWGLAGGLTPANVTEAIRATRAPLVDVSSGVESAPGVKDEDKIRAFLEAVTHI